MKKTLMSAAAVMTFAFGLAGAAQAQDTLKKIKDSGSITIGVRESSGALAFTLGDGKYTGFHYDVCQRVIADIQKQLGMAKIDVKYQPVTSQNRIPLVQNGSGDVALPNDPALNTVENYALTVIRGPRRSGASGARPRWPRTWPTPRWSTACVSA